MTSLLAFSLGELKCALPLNVVEHSYRAVAITPLPGAPAKILGIINVHGVVHPVIDLRRCFGWPQRPVSPADHLVIGKTTRRKVALIVDTVEGVMECAEQDIAAADSIIPGLDFVAGILRLKDGMLLIHDLERFLSLEEEALLDHALESCDADIAP